MNRILLLGFILMNLFFNFHDLALSQSAGVRHVIRVKGSDDMAGQVDRLSREFMAKNPKVNIIVSAGIRGTSFSDFFNGDCEVIMSGHDLSVEERETAHSKGIDLTERLIGYGGLAFITHPDNTMNELTVDQLKALIKGDFASWNEVGGPNWPVIVISLEHLGSDVRLYLLHDFLKVPTVKSHVDRVNSFGGIVRKVASTPGSLGFCRLRDLEQAEALTTKTLKIKPDSSSLAVMPSRAAIADGSYPIKRPFFLSYDKKAASHVIQFVEFVASRGWMGK